MASVRKLDLLYRSHALRWGEAVLQYEEANLTIGARDFSKVVNKQVTGFAQGTRSIGVNANFPLPADILMDCNILRVAQIKTRITGRNDDWAWGVVHRIKPNEFGTSPRYFYPKLGTLKFKNPYRDKKLAAELQEIEDMKQKFLGVLFDSDKLREDEKEIVRKAVKKTPDQEYHINFVLEHPDDFGWDPTTGEFSFKEIQSGPKGEWALGATSTSRIKNVAEKRMKNAARVETIPLPGEKQPEPSTAHEEPPEAHLGD